MLDQIRSVDFRPLLHETFQLFVNPWGEPYDSTVHGAPRRLELIDVSDLDATNVVDPDRRYPFSLIFHEPGRSYLAQRIYRIAHPALGHIDLFLVPLGPDKQGMQYQAVFN